MTPKVIILFEGREKSGKSTLIHELAATLSSQMPPDSIDCIHVPYEGGDREEFVNTWCELVSSSDSQVILSDRGIISNAVFGGDVDRAINILDTSRISGVSIVLAYLQARPAEIARRLREARYSNPAAKKPYFPDIIQKGIPEHCDLVLLLNNNDAEELARNANMLRLIVSSFLV